MLRARIRTLGVSLDEEQQIIAGAVKLIDSPNYEMTIDELDRLLIIFFGNDAVKAGESPLWDILPIGHKR